MLEVLIDDECMLEINEHELPCEERFSIHLNEPGTTLSFVEALGERRDHELSFEQGWLHLTVRVQKNGVCQVDALISESETPDEKEFNAGVAQGIRFQPFFLETSGMDDLPFKGHGLFRRGMHHPGVASQANLSLSCVCDDCRQSFRIQSIHTGLAHVGYFYSASGKHTLLVPEDIPGCPAAQSEPDPGELEELELRLPTAPDGSSFSYFNSFRCPHCNAAYIDFENFPEERKDEFYANVYFGEKPLSWEE